MGMMSEFKDFAMRGNVMDMAIGIVLGGAFGKIVTSAVNDMLMPLIGKAMGGVDFSQMFVNLTSENYGSLQAAEEAGASIMRHGSFIQTIIDFLIIAFAIFMVVKAMNSAKKDEEEAPAAPPAQEVLLSEIRDLLKK